MLPEDAPVVRLDTAGQYSIVATNVPDYLLASVLNDQFDATRSALIDIGSHCSESLDRILNSVDALSADGAFIDPNAFRDAQCDEIAASHD